MIIDASHVINDNGKCPMTGCGCQIIAYDLDWIVIKSRVLKIQRLSRKAVIKCPKCKELIELKNKLF